MLPALSENEFSGRRWRVAAPGSDEALVVVGVVFAGHTIRMSSDRLRNFIFLLFPSFPIPRFPCPTTQNRPLQLPYRIPNSAPTLTYLVFMSKSPTITILKDLSVAVESPQSHGLESTCSPLALHLQERPIHPRFFSRLQIFIYC